MDEAVCGYAHDPEGKGSDKLVFFGPQLKVNLGFDPNYVAALGKAPVPDVSGLDALIDTGAVESYIDSALAKEFDFPPINESEAIIIGGVLPVTVHLAQIYVPALDFVLYGRLAAVDLEASGIGCHVLLGRTFLQGFTLAYNGPSGHVVIKHAM